MPGRNERPTQEQRVHAELLKANGTWLSTRYFIHELFLTQVHRAIHNLEHRDGIVIEHSSFKDEHGFLSYRIAPAGQEEPQRI